MQKEIIKTIKYKAEIINWQDDKTKAQALDDVASKLVLNSPTNGVGKHVSLKYQKCPQLNLSNVKHIKTSF